MTRSTYSPPPPAYRGAAPRQPVRRRRPGPYYRPPWLLRSLIGLGALGAVLFTVALMWSDRAPGVLEPVLKSGVKDLWYRIDPEALGAGSVGGEVTREDLPRTDFMLHVGIWGTVSALVITALWTWRSMIVSVVTLCLLSYAIELGQGRYSSTRQVEFTDAIANTIGIGLGAIAALFLFVAYDALARFVVALFGGPHRR